MPLVCSLGCSLISSNSYKGKIVIFCTALNELKHKSSNSYKGKIVIGETNIQELIQSK